jgi:hypothetical protein
VGRLVRSQDDRQRRHTDQECIMKRRRRLPKILTRRVKIEQVWNGEEEEYADPAEAKRRFLTIMEAITYDLKLCGDEDTEDIHQPAHLPFVRRPWDPKLLGDPEFIWGLAFAALAELYPKVFKVPRGAPSRRSRFNGLRAHVQARKAKLGAQGAIEEWARAHRMNPKTVQREYYRRSNFRDLLS